MAKKKEAPLMVRGFTIDVKKRIKQAARDEGLGTMSALIRKLTLNHLKEKEAQGNG